MVPLAAEPGNGLAERTVWQWVVSKVIGARFQKLMDRARANVIGHQDDLQPQIPSDLDQVQCRRAVGLIFGADSNAPKLKLFAFCRFQDLHGSALLNGGPSVGQLLFQLIGQQFKSFDVLRNNEQFNLCGIWP